MTITDRDKLGRIKKGGKVLTSEQASKQGKMQREKGKKQASSKDELLKDAGYDEPEDAPVTTRLMADAAAKGNVTAIRTFAPNEETPTVKGHGYPQPNEKCPTCSQYVLADLQITEGEERYIIYSLDFDGNWESKEGIEAEIAKLTKLLADYQQPEKIAQDWEDEPDIASDTGSGPLTQ